MFLQVMPNSLPRQITVNIVKLKGIKEHGPVYCWCTQRPHKHANVMGRNQIA